MNMIKKKRELPLGSSPKKYTFQIVVLFFVLMTVILTFIWNSVLINRGLKKSTEEYISQVAGQLESDLSYRFKMNTLYVEQLADSIERMTEQYITDEFLERKAEAFDFDHLVIVREDGTISPKNFSCPHIREWIASTDTAYDHSQISYVDDHKILFSTPLTKGTSCDAVLVGIYEQESVKQMLKSSALGKRGWNCMSDVTGKILITPSNIRPFLKIQDMIQQGGTVQDHNAIREMTDDIAKGRDGMIYIHSVRDTPLIVSYRFLGVKNWILFTMVQEDLITEGSQSYMQRTVIVIGGIALAFAFIILGIWKSSRKHQQYIDDIAFSDSLTKGMNNAAFLIRCREMLDKNSDSGYAMIYLNIKDFKYINENFGVQEGNKTLYQVYQILRCNTTEHELVTRSDGDHFFVLLNESTEDRIRERLAHFELSLNRYGRRESMRYRMQVVQGVYVIEDATLDVRIMQDRARVATTYQSGEEYCVFYNHELSEKMNAQMRLNALFEESLKNHDFQVYLQPKVVLDTQKVGGAEALVRWIHPEKGMIFPSDFIPLFEANGNICKLDLYMFEEVCRLMQRWMQEGKELIPISVNLSRRNIIKYDFLEEYVRLKEKYGIPDDMIEFEMTESVFVNESQISLFQDMIRKMHDSGFLCSLDDFGCGYSSLAMLKEFEVDVLKLDRQFFVGENEKMWKVISKLISLANDLGMKVVAEGIEENYQLEKLGAMDCDMVQGYIYARPLSVLDFEQWLDQREGGNCR